MGGASEAETSNLMDFFFFLLHQLFLSFIRSKLLCYFEVRVLFLLFQFLKTSE